MKKTTILLCCCLLGTASRGATAPDENLLRNGSFEVECANASLSSAYYWTEGEPDHYGDNWGNAARQDWRALDGWFIGTLCGTWAERGNGGGWWQDSPAKSGHSYRFSGWFYADAHWQAARQVVMMEFRDASNSNILLTTSHDLAEVRDAWSEVTLEATAPNETVYVRVVVHVEGAGTDGALQFDSFSLLELLK